MEKVIAVILQEGDHLGGGVDVGFEGVRDTACLGRRKYEHDCYYSDDDANMYGNGTGGSSKPTKFHKGVKLAAHNNRMLGCMKVAVSGLIV
jgi:hypothetical protein